MRRYTVKVAVMLSEYYPVIWSAVNSVYPTTVLSKADMFNEGVIITIELLDKNQNPTTFNGYLKKTIRGKLLNMLEREKRSASIRCDPMDDVVSEEQIYIDDETRQTAHDMVFAHLPEDPYHRKLIWSEVLECKSVMKIAREFEKSTGMVYNKRKQAFSAMRKRVLTTINQ